MVDPTDCMFISAFLNYSCVLSTATQIGSRIFRVIFVSQHTTLRWHNLVVYAQVYGSVGDM